LRQIFNTVIEYETQEYSKPDYEIIKDFISIFSDEKYQGKIFVLNNDNLRNKKELGIKSEEIFKIFLLNNINREGLIKACSSHGHISVLFVPNYFEEFVQIFLKKGHYELVYAEINMNDVSKYNPLDKSQIKTFYGLFESGQLSI